MKRSRRILVSPLDWGLGHASRLSVVVGHLLSRGHEVVLAGSGASLSLLQADFPNLPSVSLKSFSPCISEGHFLWLRIAVQSPLLLFSIWREHRQTAQIVADHRIDTIISDNRYGVRSRLCRSYIITHQLRPLVATHAPQFLNSLLSSILCHWIRRFDACLVPDYQVGGLSGRLSSPVPKGIRAHAIGILSRLAFQSNSVSSDDEKIGYLGIASGAEPGRTQFVSYLVNLFSQQSARCVIVSGAGNAVSTNKNITIMGYADAATLQSLISRSQHIVCRSGYSTLMDLYALHRNATLVPTLGQAEQEYLAARWATLHAK